MYIFLISDITIIICLCMSYPIYSYYAHHMYFAAECICAYIEPLVNKTQCV